VCVTTGLLDLLSGPELEGVLAHELTHIIDRDVMVMTIASFFASIAAVLRALSRYRESRRKGALTRLFAAHQPVEKRVAALGRLESRLQSTWTAGQPASV
jgi:hypothetical protein